MGSSGTGSCSSFIGMGSSGTGSGIIGMGSSGSGSCSLLVLALAYKETK